MSFDRLKSSTLSKTCNKFGLDFMNFVNIETMKKTL